MSEHDGKSRRALPAFTFTGPVTGKKIDCKLAYLYLTSNSTIERPMTVEKPAKIEEGELI